MGAVQAPPGWPWVFRDWGWRFLAVPLSMEWISKTQFLGQSTYVCLSIHLCIYFVCVARGVVDVGYSWLKLLSCFL